MCAVPRGVFLIARTVCANHRAQYPTALFFKHNTALGPPYRVIVDTNFINFSIKNKIEMVRGMMDCLLAKCEPRKLPARIICFLLMRVVTVARVVHTRLEYNV